MRVKIEGGNRLEVDPMRYENKDYPYRLVAEETGEKPIYNEAVVSIYDKRTGEMVVDVYFLIDERSGEPCFLSSANGEADAHVVRFFPMRPIEKMMEVGEQ